MDARLDENKTKLNQSVSSDLKVWRTSWTYFRVFVFLVALEMLANSNSFLDEHVANVQLVETFDTSVNELTDPLESQVRDLSITTSAYQTERWHMYGCTIGLENSQDLVSCVSSIRWFQSYDLTLNEPVTTLT